MLARIDADLFYKSLMPASVVDSDSGELLYVTSDTADRAKRQLRPWAEIAEKPAQLSDEDLAVMWLKEFGDKISVRGQ